MKWTPSPIATDFETKISVREDNSDKLFEIVPKLCIEPNLNDNTSGDGCVSKGPTRVVAAATVGTECYFGLAMDCDLLIVNGALDKVQRQMEFESRIDFVVWRRSVLVIGFSSSKILLVNATTFEILDARTICVIENPVDRFFLNAFIHSNPNPAKVDMVIIGVNGIVYNFMDVCLSAGSLDHTLDDVSMDIDISTIKGTVFKILPQGTQLTSVCSPKRDIIVTADTQNNLTMFSYLEVEEDKENRDDDDDDDDFENEKYFATASVLDITTVQIPKGTQFFVKKIDRYDGVIFLLYSTGHLELFLEETFYSVGKLVLPSAQHLVEDFQVVVMNLDVIKLWVIFHNPQDSSHWIGIAPSPRFDFEFTVPIPSLSNSSAKSTFTFPSSSSSLEEPRILVEQNPITGATKIFHMEEFSTDISLKNLLLQGKFDKAELLARKYSKPMDLVWKAKVTLIYSLMLTTFDQDELQLFEDMKRILGQIEDSTFVYTFVVDAILIRVAWVEELLEMGRKRLGLGNVSEVGKKLLNSIKKFYTFRQVLPGDEIERWNEFNSPTTSMFQQCCEFLQRLQFKECEIIWLRHCDEFLPEIELGSFAPFFRKLFSLNLNSSAGISLFSTIFPCALEKCEKTLENSSDTKLVAVISLVLHQIRILESEQTQWPEEAVQFLEVLLQAVEEEEGKLQGFNDLNESRYLERAAICAEIVERLRIILQALRDLKHIYDSHRIRIMFDKFYNEDKLDVVNVMLDSILGKDEIAIFFTNFLIPFTKRHGLDMDSVIEYHINHLCNEVAFYLCSASIPFEERMVTLVDNVVSVSVKLRCVNTLSVAWPVPWCRAMSGVVSRALRLNVEGDPDLTKLQNTISLLQTQEPYRVLLHKYSLSASNYIYGFNVVHTIKRILKSQKPGSFADCLELIKHTGRCGPDDVRRIKFWHELSETTFPLSEVLAEPVSIELTQKFLNRIVEQFRQAPDLLYRDAEPWDRYTECARLLANRVQDDKVLQFLQLRSILKEFWSIEPLYQSDYPYCVLTLILEENCEEPAPVIISLCHRLSSISFTHVKDMLLTTASFFCHQCHFRAAELSKIWSLVLEIVRLPGFFRTEGDVVAYAGLAVARHLSKLIPSSTCDQLEILAEFYAQIFGSFPGELGIIEPIVKLMAILTLFRDLRDKEIPLENDFMNIYSEVWIEGRKGVKGLLPELKTFGESLLKFGDKELFDRIFSAVTREYEHQAQNCFGKMKTDLEAGSGDVLSIKIALLQNMAQYEVTEKNSRVLNLVKALESAGFQLNAYALRQRNKAKLIQRLVQIHRYSLASQIGLVFDFRDGPSWSLVLREYIDQATVTELKTLLEALKKISELWVIPEFAEGWIKVSEEFPNFRHICPIPLTN